LQHSHQQLHHFVEVAAVHDAVVRPLHGNHRAQAVIAQLFRQRLHPLDHDFAHRFFKARWTGCIGQRLQELLPLIARCGGARLGKACQGKEQNKSTPDFHSGGMVHRGSAVSQMRNSIRVRIVSRIVMLCAFAVLFFNYMPMRGINQRLQL
jgi:hypothetical protein